MSKRSSIYRLGGSISNKVHVDRGSNETDSTIDEDLVQVPTPTPPPPIEPTPEIAPSSPPPAPPKKPKKRKKRPPLPAPPGIPNPVPPEYIQFHKDVEDDGIGFKATLEGLTNPQTYMYVRHPFRTVAFLSLPMFTIAIHPNTLMRLKFPDMLIAAVISTSTHRPSLGEQIGFHSWVWRSLVCCLVIGTLSNAWNLHKHIPAWYGYIATCIFLTTLCSNGAIRRFIYLHIFVYLMQIRLYHNFFGLVPVDNAAWYVADHMIGTFLGMAALCFPYPILTKKLVDTILSKVFEGVGKLLAGMIMFLWSPDPRAPALFYGDKSPFDKIEFVMSVMPALLWFSNWEPTEFLIRNNIRRLKLSLLRRIMSLTYAAFSAGQTIVNMRKEAADQMALKRIREELWRQTHPAKAVKAPKKTDPLRVDSSTSSSESEYETETDEEQDAQQKAAALRKNTGEYVVAFAGMLAKTIGAIGAVDSKPKTLLEKVPFDAIEEKDRLMRRNMRMELLLNLERREKQAEEQRRRREQETEKKSAKSKGSSSAGPPTRNSTHVPFGDSDDANMNSSVSSNTMRDDYEDIEDMQSVINDMEVFIRLNEVFFHVLLSMIASEIQNFRELMEEYKPSQGVFMRLVTFFVVEPWNSFWRDAYDQLTFAHRENFRSIKDAIKMTCAFLSACALNFEIWIVPNGLYFFGTTILLGFPQEEESLSLAVNRLSGNTMGCAVGYLAYHHTKNLSEKIGFTLCFVFLFYSLRNHTAFGQNFFYAGTITMAGLATSIMTYELLTRILASSYTVFAYFLCVSLIFPLNPIKILWSTRCKLAKAISQVVDDVAYTVRVPIEYDPEYDPSEDTGDLPDTDVLSLCANLNVEVDLMDRLLHSCEKWTPFAASDNVIRGTAPFPTGASYGVLAAQRRIAANAKLLVFGVQLIHRRRNAAPDDGLQRLMQGSIAKFLDDFAGAVRLVTQDFIDSIQLCRKWSYPNSLRNVSYLSRMRPRLYAVLFEMYVCIGRSLKVGVINIEDEHYERIENETFGTTQTPSPQSRESPSNLLNETFAADPNASFADHVLLMRRTAEDREAEGTSLEATMNNPSFSMGGTYRHRAKLAGAEAAPPDMFPFTRENEQRVVSRELDRKKEEDEKSHSIDKSESRGASLQVSFAHAQPKKSKSRQLAAKRGIKYVPTYSGPQFSYREDQMDLPIDTDFTALISILASCNAIISEIETLTGPINGVSDYQKQLHESTLILNLIDGVSEKLEALHRRQRRKYHPLPPGDLGTTTMGTQADTWHAWRF